MLQCSIVWARRRPVVKRRGWSDSSKKQKSGTAKGAIAEHGLRRRRFFEARKAFLSLKRLLQYREQTFKRPLIALLDGGAERSLHLVVARNVERVGQAHLFGAAFRRRSLARLARLPAGQPGIERAGVAELAAQRGRVAGVQRIGQVAVGQGEVSALGLQQVEPVAGQGVVLRQIGHQAKLAAQLGAPVVLVAHGESVDHLGGERHGACSNGSRVSARRARFHWAMPGWLP